MLSEYHRHRVLALALSTSIYRLVLDMGAVRLCLCECAAGSNAYVQDSWSFCCVERSSWAVQLAFSARTWPCSCIVAWLV